eukprot:619246-Alexandrium_andersonii.AAC.1
MPILTCVERVIAQRNALEKGKASVFTASTKPVVDKTLQARLKAIDSTGTDAWIVETKLYRR